VSFLYSQYSLIPFLVIALALWAWALWNDSSG